MVIVKFSQCLNELNEEVKKKIIEKQDELFSTELNSLEERFRCAEFRKKLLKNLSDIEKKYFITFLRKYSLYNENSRKEEQSVSTEEKLALLLLRQKGLLFEVKKQNQNQRFVMPAEITESFLELYFNKREETSNDAFSVSTKQYLYLLIELLLFINNKKINKTSALERFDKHLSTSVNSALLLKYLEYERLVKKMNGQYIILDENCDQFFQRANKDIKQSLTFFILNDYLKDVFIVFFLLYRFRKGSISIEEIENIITKQSQENMDTVYKVIEQLTSLDIVTKTREDIIVSLSDELLEEDKKISMVAGKCDFLIPVYIDNETLWNFRCWGEFVHWEAMVHVTFKPETVANGLKMKRDIQKLINHLEKFIAKADVLAFEGAIGKWLEYGRPIIKKTNVTFYSITENLHIKYVEQHWHHWWALCEAGITIEKEMETKFELLLQKCSLTVVEHKKEQDKQQRDSLITIENLYPEFASVFPEIEKLPEQWFSLTAYDERTLQRIIKQAIILQIPIEVQIGQQEIIKMYPLKMHIDKGCYVVFGRNNNNIRLQQISKLAIVHPLKM